MSPQAQRADAPAPTPAGRRAVLRLAPLFLIGAAAVLASFSSCKPPASSIAGKPIVERIVLHAAPDARPVPPDRNVATIDIPRDRDVSTWRIDALKNAVQSREIPLNGGLKAVPILVVHGPGAKRVGIPGSYDPKTFDTVLLRILAFVPEGLRVGFARGGKDVLVSDFHMFEGSKDPYHEFYEFPQAARESEPFDELFFESQPKQGVLALVGFDLLTTAIESRMPMPEDGESPITISGESRLGIGVSTGRALESETLVPPGGRLAFSYGRPPKAAVGAARLLLTLSNEQGAKRTEEFSLSAPGRGDSWLKADLDLAEFADRRMKLRFELKADKDDAAAIAEPTVYVRGSEAPTVLLVTSDTHRYDYLGTTVRSGTLKTPRLDELGARGVFFEDAFTSTNVTNPSHISLMTATSPRDTGIVNNHTRLSPSATTLAEAFRANGYVTYASVCAEHLANESSGLGQGFDRLAFPRVNFFDAENAIDRLFEWLPDADGRPLFVWLHFFDAHHPYGPPGRFDRMYWDKGTDPFDPKAPKLSLPGGKTTEAVFPPDLVELRDLDFPLAQYRGEITYLDEQLGRVFDHQRFAIAWIGLTADHGESFGEHGVYYDHAGAFPSNLHVPLIVAGPGVPEGLHVAAPSRQIDLGRTLLDLAGLRAQSFAGNDLLALARGELDGSEPRFSLSAHAFDASITKDGWHLIMQLRDQIQKNIVIDRKKNDVHLYHLTEDPLAEHDLADDPAQAERVAKLRSELIAWLKASRPMGWAEHTPLTATRKAALEGLGYAADGGSDDIRVWYEEDSPAPSKDGAADGSNPNASTNEKQNQ